MSPLVALKALGIRGVVAVLALAWGAHGAWQSRRLSNEVRELQAVTVAHEAGARAWESVYRQQESEAQSNVDEALQWWREDGKRADSVIGGLRERLRNVAAGAGGSAVPGGAGAEGSSGRLTCDQRLDGSASEIDELGGAAEDVGRAIEEVRAALTATRAVLRAAPCVKVAP